MLLFYLFIKKNIVFDCFLRYIFWSSIYSFSFLIPLWLFFSQNRHLLDGPIIYKNSLVVFITLNFRINFSSNPAWNVLICRNLIFLFQMWLGVWMWLMHLYIFCHCITSIRKRWILMVFLFRKMRDSGNLFLGGWYSTMNANFMIHFFPFICIVQRIALFWFYRVDIVQVHYSLKVDNVIYVVVYDNHLWHLLLSNNANYVLDYFRYSGVIDIL